MVNLNSSRLNRAQFTDEEKKDFKKIFDRNEALYGYFNRIFDSILTESELVLLDDPNWIVKRAHYDGRMDSIRNLKLIFNLRSNDDRSK